MCTVNNIKKSLTLCDTARVRLSQLVETPGHRVHARPVLLTVLVIGPLQVPTR